MNGVFYVKKHTDAKQIYRYIKIFEVLTFLKRKAKDYCLKKLKTHTHHKIFSFLTNSSDDNYLMIKVKP